MLGCVLLCAFTRAARAQAALAGPSKVDLPHGKYAPAVVSVPVGATKPLPIVVALHGNFDRPEWQCDVWGPLFAERAFVLCPRGIPRRDVSPKEDRWEYASQRAVLAEIDSAIAALRARFGDFVSSAPLTLIGFSLGAIFGAPIARAAPARFPRVVLIEGGLTGWSAANVRRFVAKGGQRLLIACSQLECMNRARQLAPVLEREGLPTHFAGDTHSGHSYAGKVALAVAEQLDWFLGVNTD